MTQVSMVGFAVGGAFLSLTYYDYPLNLMVVVVASRPDMTCFCCFSHSCAAALALLYFLKCECVCVLKLYMLDRRRSFLEESERKKSELN